METVLKYTIFKTKWGYFGLAGTEYALYRTCLPGLSPEKLKSLLLKGLSLKNRASLVRHSFNEGERIEHRLSAVASAKAEVSSIDFDKTFFKEIQQQIIDYFEGAYVNFSSDIPLMLDGLSPFCKSVLTACKFVKFGQTINYGELAKKLGRPLASRAVGNALAKNPLPLIIPCHRVIRSNGSLGGFSATGGLNLKAKLLEHETKALLTCKGLHKH